MNHDELLNKVFATDELRDKRVLVALSGGADSVALLRLLLSAGINCHAAHCNFHLRGEESMRDERFVRDLCKRLGVPLTVKDFDVAAWQQKHGGSVEMACRELRYAWFEDERRLLSCDLIAVAHHADDQVETVFLNLMRGTRIRGLSGMKKLSGNIWRPLLGISRTDILAFLEEIDQDYVTDSTNAQNDYRRNRLRNIVLPVIEQQFPQGRERILDTIDNVADDNDLLMELIQQTIPDERHIAIDSLCSHPHAPTLLYHCIRHLGFNREQCTQAVEAARHSNTGRKFKANGFLLVVNRQSLDIELISESQDIEIPLDLHSGITHPINLSISRGDIPFSPLMCDGKRTVAFNTQIFDCQRIVLRHWRRGDRMKPYGMNGSKLLSDMFNDLKLDHADRQNAWLLEADGNILWVLGHRSAAYYPVKKESQDYVILKLI